MRECPECHGSFEPYKRAESRQIYCSEACRTRHWKVEHGQAVRKPDRGLTRSERVLERLRQGPATALDLIRAGGGTAATSRVRELRGRGYEIECDQSGEHPVYRLVRENG